MNILISSLGMNCVIVEEALGLFNYSDNDIYSGNVNYSKIKDLRWQLRLEGHSVDEVWLIATDKKSINRGNTYFNSALEDFEQLKGNADSYGVRYRIFLLDGINDISSVEDAKGYHDLTLKVMAYAKRMKGVDGKVYVSLACGRKTMSTDIQDAANCFGCDLLFHILGDSPKEALPICLGEVKPNPAICYDFYFHGDSDIIRCKSHSDVLSEIESQKARSHYFFTSFYLKNNSRNNFRILYTLPGSEIERLQNEKIGVDKSRMHDELSYLAKLPKTELHCHLGGVLLPCEMIEVAHCFAEDIMLARRENKKYSKWLDTLDSIDVGYLNSENIKDWTSKTMAELGVESRGLIVAPFLLRYEDKVDELEKFIYGEKVDESKFCKIGIDAYEHLGDLQGSALLCNEKALRMTLRILFAKCKKENVQYLEIRCSPLNYATPSFDKRQVMMSILEEIDCEKEINISVILITSRHADREKIIQGVNFADEMKNEPLFAKYFRGFDLAGAESAAKAMDMRDYFIDAMKDCRNITIHAGETEDVESIWQAVYYLNAERIGHGLTLIEKKDLMGKFLERGIGIEMCPSSNFQIKGFRDNYLKGGLSDDREYPLKEYMDNELKVSVNTDDPGISRTDITHELLKAARMTKGGLSKWEILQLIYNGFNTAFYPYSEKKKLIAKAEEALAKLIRNSEL